MPSTPSYGVLLVGGAHTHQENYARAFAADPRCRLVGLTEMENASQRQWALAARLAADLVVPLIDDFDAALGRGDVDIVCVCAQAEHCGTAAGRAAAAGKHVYIDKPPASVPAQIAEVPQRISAAGVRSQVFSLVRAPIARQAKEIVGSGRLGELVGVHCEMLFAKGHAGTADLASPRSEKPAAERFTFLDAKRELHCVGYYPLVFFQWLTGRRFESLYCSTANYFFAEHQRRDVEDFAAMLLRMQGGVDASLFVGRTGWTSHPGFGVHQLHLVGTAGCVTLDAFRPRLEIHSAADPWRPPPVPHPEDPMGFWSSTQQENGIRPKEDWWPVDPVAQSDASYFVDCIEHGRESDVPAAVGCHAAEAILKGYQSAAESRWIELG
jgi:predicted dehydrogenase